MNTTAANEGHQWWETWKCIYQSAPTHCLPYFFISCLPLQSQRTVQIRTLQCSHPNTDVASDCSSPIYCPWFIGFVWLLKVWPKAYLAMCLLVHWKCFHKSKTWVLWSLVYMKKSHIIIFFFLLYYLQHLTFLLQSEVCLTYSKADPFLLNYEKKNQKN